MGLTHGMTNLGGALLAIMASGRSTDKMVIRYTIAYYYLAFSIIQMFVISVLLQRHDILIANLPAAAIAAAIYLLIGNRIFSSTSDPTYNKALTVFMVVYGVVVLLEI